MTTSPLATLTDCDAATQENCSAIMALARAARDCLDLDAHKIERADVLLRQIDALANELLNTVNWHAERHGVNHRDESQGLRRRALWDKHRALHGAGVAARVAEPAHAGGQP